MERIKGTEEGTSKSLSSVKRGVIHRSAMYVKKGLTADFPERSSHTQARGANDVEHETAAPNRRCLQSACSAIGSFAVWACSATASPARPNSAEPCDPWSRSLG